MTHSEAPNVAVLLAPVIERVPASAQHRFLALLERGAAERYRQWAAASEHRAALLECAAREEGIAERVERLFPASDATLAQLAALVPEARAIYLSLFVGLPLQEQMRIQASAERQGAAAWRAFAAAASDDGVRSTLEHCALLEEESAAFLDRLLD
jgi:hypothetical protein